MPNNFYALHPVARLEMIDAFKEAEERYRRSFLQRLREMEEEIVAVDTPEEAFKETFAEVELAFEELELPLDFAEKLVDYLEARGWRFHPPFTRVKMRRRREPRVKRLRRGA